MQHQQWLPPMLQLIPKATTPYRGCSIQQGENTMLLELLQADGHTITKIGVDEYHGFCPWCGGDNQLLVWEEKNRYYCRQCCAQGDAIQYLRLYRRMGYFEAAILTENQISTRNLPSRRQH